MATWRWNQRVTGLGILALVALAGLALWLSTGAQAAAPAKHVKTLTVDVAQDMTSTVFDDAPVHADGLPAYGNLFVIQGFIYPEGTLDESNGIIVSQDEAGNPVVEPEFPDQVIGRWICRGWFLGDGMHTQDEPWAITTQIFDFADGYGGETIVSEGYEIPFGLEATVHRAVMGGTGKYTGAQGAQAQKLVGINATQAANFRIDLTLTK